MQQVRYRHEEKDPGVLPVNWSSVDAWPCTREYVCHKQHRTKQKNPQNPKAEKLGAGRWRSLAIGSEGLWKMEGEPGLLLGL